MKSDPLLALPDLQVQDLLRQLHHQADKESLSLVWSFLDQLPRLALGRSIRWDRFDKRLQDKFICLDRSQGVFCYLLARALQARKIVEFGTSFGVSTIYLALAVRENGGGWVIGMKWCPQRLRAPAAICAKPACSSSWRFAKGMLGTPSPIWRAQST